MEPAESRLNRIAHGVVASLGYELVGVEHLQRGGGQVTLRVYIDHERGIGLDDCAAVSEQLSAVLDVEDPLQGQYDLEISSPGLDRPLVFPAHFERFAGSRAKVRLSEKIAGRRTLEGVLIGCDGTVVNLEVDGHPWAIPLDRIENARLVPVY
ncbi:ribosome maturation factor RimP [Thiocapsa imhoffii]|uniref:Ribosome maturation factor RimP n=1 Tax=Thiocapsa imhoffii TaxID=382777 RepID=A0A9X1B8G7_9GAMM|nr:ribosome maturation factor RimP [Thiocapsa imhoffii]MBK1644747.1 ribosome maturation factor RimP [Thiocapsa imhoffii]